MSVGLMPNLSQTKGIYCMNEFDIDKAYVSPYDKLLRQFDQEHAPSESQLQEINKYKRINALRDNGLTEDSKSSTEWEKF